MTEPKKPKKNNFQRPDHRWSKFCKILFFFVFLVFLDFCRFHAASGSVPNQTKLGMLPHTVLKTFGMRLSVPCLLGVLQFNWSDSSWSSGNLEPTCCVFGCPGDVGFLDLHLDAQCKYWLIWYRATITSTGTMLQRNVQRAISKIYQAICLWKLSRRFRRFLFQLQLKMKGN